MNQVDELTAISTFIKETRASLQMANLLNKLGIINEKR